MVKRKKIMHYNNNNIYIYTSKVNGMDHRTTNEQGAYWEIRKVLAYAYELTVGEKIHIDNEQPSRTVYSEHSL